VLDDAFAEARQAFEALCVELGQEGATHRLALQAAVLRLLAIVARVTAPRESNVSRLDEWQRVKLRLSSELNASLPVEKLARELGVSVEHFCRQFKQRFGTSPKAFHTRLRIREAARLLNESERSIKAIALELGFHNPRAFSRNFKHLFGVSPADFRAGDRDQPAPSSQPREGPFPMNRHVLPPRTGLKWYRQALKKSALRTAYR
jgi:AraC-like DNA-binding protein